MSQFAAHARDFRLVHNDIKPMNVFLNAEGEALVGDFGFASLIIAPRAASVTPPGASPETAAPEIAAGWNTPAVTASFGSDQYALGATAYWLLAARTPVDLSSAADFVGAVSLVLTAPPRLRDVAPHVPQYVAAAISRQWRAMSEIGSHL